MIPVEETIVKLAETRPGIAQSDVIRETIQKWTPAHIRQRIAILEARGALKVTRDTSGRLFLHPADAAPEATDAV